MPDDRPERLFESHAAFDAWLAEHQDDERGALLILAKKGAPYRTVTNAECLDLALAYGWIDGVRRARDEHSYLQSYTPRRARSPWSQRNVELAEAKIAAGTMRPRGLAEVEKARADGRWDRAYAGSAGATTHPVLQAALDADAPAAAAYAALSRANRFRVSFRLQGLKRDDTVARHVADIVEGLRAGRAVF